MLSLTAGSTSGFAKEPGSAPAVPAGRSPFGAVRQTLLDNGLAVVWEQDPRQGLVAIEVRILGGLRGEGRFLGSGITHAIEHMLFKGTTSRAPGTIEQEVRRYGGTINAFTSHDYTGVNLFVESRFLKDALGMLADILQHATFPEEEFAKERPVIVSEIQMNLDDPERRVHQLFWNRQFLLHPYRHPILGYQPLLERLTAEDLRSFYVAQYVPNNIVLACVGDLDGAAFPALVREVFGAWPRGAPYTVPVAEEPPAVSVKQAQEELPVQAAYTIIGFPSVRLAHPDLYALDVLASVLGHGRSSRLHEALVRVKRVAHGVGAGNYTPLDPGAFTVSMRTDGGRAAEAVEAALQVVEEVARKGVSEAELQKTKRQVTAEFIFRHQTVESKADDYASSYALTGDPTYSNRYVQGISQVTAEQVQQAARRYLDRAKMTVVTIQPSGTAPARPSEAVWAPPTATKTVLPNGLTVLLSEQRRLPMAAIVAVSRGGVRVETDGTQGLSNLVSQLLVKGTSRKTATQIATQVESLGGILEPFSGRDGLGLSLQVLAEDLPVGLDLVHELLTDAAFPKDELELQRQLILKELDAREDDVFDVGGRLLRRTLFTTHPYRFDPLGSKEAVTRLTREECLAFARRWLVAKNLVVAVFGDLQPDAVQRAIRQRFGSMPPGDAPWPQTLSDSPLDGARQASQVLPKEQTVIFIGFRGTQATAEDRDALDVLTSILSGMSGRLFQAVREQQGLSYTLGAFNVPGWDPGYVAVYAATRPGERAQVLDTIQTQLREVVERGVTGEELDQAQRYLIGHHRMELQHLGSLARRAALDELYGLGADAWTTYEARINAVTAEQVQEAARRYLQWSHRAEVVVAP
ncbi:MAG: insulinase family protein [Candidatus Omnitrophica bacterium]|nr:insulinase family protein [Candidatus Omnitrophota bacterium]